MTLGCGPGFDFTGTWKGRRSLEGAPDSDPVIVGNLNRVVLTVKPNGRFDLLDFGMPQAGTWRSSGLSANLQIDQVFDQPLRKGEQVDHPKLEAREDGTVAFASKRGLVILKRESQPSP